MKKMFQIQMRMTWTILMACDTHPTCSTTSADHENKDMLDDFKDVKIDSKKASESQATQPVSSSEPPVAPPVAEAAAPAGDEDVLSDDDFAKQLQAGMAELMGEIESSVRSFTSQSTVDSKD